jgi:hypothetical protein
MPHDSWQGAVADIREATGTVTSKQQQVAAVAGLKLPDHLPRLVAGARLQAALNAELGLLAPGPCSDAQQEIISSLETDVYRDITPSDWREAYAWINFLRLKKREQALEELQLQAGDVVETQGSDDGQLGEVSSIGSSGRIHFTGGAGAGAWPDMVVIRSRKGDNTANAGEFKRKAANQAATRARASGWSESKQLELEEYKVNSPLTFDHVEQLQEVIESARDEKPIQQFIEAYPQVLTALLGGRTRFCIPRLSLGGKYTPDFFMSDINSLGVRWVFVELETPDSDVTLKGRNDLEDHARKGVSQVKEWREWLQNNLDVARRSKRKDGLGLVDIRPRSEGVVLVGRRTRLLDNADAVRNPIREENDIQVHTYDWLLEQLTGALSFSGPPGANPFVLQPLTPTSE